LLPGVTLKYSTYQNKNCTGTPQVTLGIAGKCDIFNSLYAKASLTETSTSSSVTSKSSGTKKGCFAGSETVSLESGEVKFISDIRTGDRVLAADAAGRTSYSDVVFVPHRANSDDALFTHITTASGLDIKMTPSHIISAGPCNSSASFPLTYASSVSVGECVMTVSGEDMVSAVETAQGKGLYTVVTNEEFVVVNGIIASPFATNHMLANLCYNIHRFVYASLPSLLNWSLLHSVNEVR
jgi:Hint module